MDLRIKMPTQFKEWVSIIIIIRRGQFLFVQQNKNIPIRVFAIITTSLRAKKYYLGIDGHYFRRLFLNGLQYVFSTTHYFI